MTDEIWKDIEGWPRHQVSSRGRIRVGVEYKEPWCDSTTGYMKISRRNNGKKETYQIHVLMLNAFVGPCPPGLECRHLNGNKLDNRWPENLTWGTHAQNMEDRIFHGTDNGGERNGRSRLTQTEVNDIRSRTDYYGLNRHLAMEFGVSRATIIRIRSGVTWV